MFSDWVFIPVNARESRLYCVTPTGEVTKITNVLLTGKKLTNSMFIKDLHVTRGQKCMLKVLTHECFSLCVCVCM